MIKITEKIVMLNEARVLKEQRERKGLSVPQKGELMGVPGSLISQVENVRENVPKGDYTELDVVTELLSKLKTRDLNTVRSLIEHLKPNKIIICYNYTIA